MKNTPDDHAKQLSDDRSSDFLTLGKIVGFQGLAGLVKINLTTGNADIIENIKTALIQPQQSAAYEIEIKSLRLHGKQILIGFEGLSDRTAVEPLLGCTVSVPRTQLKSLTEDEWWMTDLIGLTVYTTSGQTVGTVSGVIDGVTPTLEVVPSSTKDESKSILIPFVKSLVPFVDIKGKRIEVVDLPGLLEPQ